jgi:protein TonB
LVLLSIDSNQEPFFAIAKRRQRKTGYERRVSVTRVSHKAALACRPNRRRRHFMKTIGSNKTSAPGISGVIIYVCAGAAILGVLSTAAYLLSERSSGTVSANLQTGMAAPNVRSSSDRAFETTSHERHIELAMSAYSADKLVAPAGENALEHYLAALKSKPDDFGAQEAILELVPVAMTALETAMAANAAEEVERLIPLLELADPSASRVIALKKRWQETIAQQASVEAARLAAAQTPELPLQDEPVAPEVGTEQLTSAPVAKSAGAPAVVVAATLAPAPAVAPEKQSTVSVRQSAPATKPAPEQSRVIEARALSTARAVFPAQARRQKIEGWVDLQVAVDAEGRVTEAVVLSAQPSRIFDVEARRAVMRWRYSPKRVNDQPVSSVLRQRIKFSLAG